jgi:hypothetical protein
MGRKFRNSGLALALASATLIAQISSIAHMALVRHAICPEHGELIHPDDLSGSAAAPKTLAKTTNPADLAIQATTQFPAVHGHDHCLLASYRRQRIAMAAGTAAVARPFPAAVGNRRMADAPRPALVALYRLAPKNSPPA